MIDEEKIELSPMEAMNILGWKKSKVYYWITSNKFEIVERVDGQKIKITRAEIERLKKKDNVQENSENFEKVLESSNISDEVQENSVQNITKNYKTFQNNTNLETFELLNKSLDAIKQMYIASSQNYNYSLKLLTDGQSTIERENIELKQEKKSVEESLKKSEREFQEKLKQFEKIQKEKNIIIAILVFIILIACFMFFLVSNGFVQF